MIAIGCDHAAVALKEELKAHLKDQGFEVEDVGIHGTGKADYPVVALKVTRAISNGTCNLGVLLCGTGVGMSIAANKVRGVRAACCDTPRCAALSREHNDSNILCMGARMITADQARETLAAWLNASFAGGRHTARVAMIGEMETPAAP